MTNEELQKYYETYKNYQADYMGLTLNVHDLIQLIRTVIVDVDLKSKEKKDKS